MNLEKNQKKAKVNWNLPRPVGSSAMGDIRNCGAIFI